MHGDKYSIFHARSIGRACPHLWKSPGLCFLHSSRLRRELLVVCHLDAGSTNSCSYCRELRDYHSCEASWTHHPCSVVRQACQSLFSLNCVLAFSSSSTGCVNVCQSHQTSCLRTYENTSFVPVYRLQDSCTWDPCDPAQLLSSAIKLLWSCRCHMLSGPFSVPGCLSYTSAACLSFSSPQQ